MCERSCGRIDAGLPVLLVCGERSRLVLLVFVSRELVEKLCFVGVEVHSLRGNIPGRGEQKSELKVFFHGVSLANWQICLQ